MSDIQTDRYIDYSNKFKIFSTNNDTNLFVEQND